MAKDLDMPCHKRAALASRNGVSKSTCVGITQGGHPQPYIPNMSLKLKKATQYINKCIQKLWPQFDFTSLQLTYHTKADIHIDKRNLGPSVVLSCGLFVGGHLWEFCPTTKQINASTFSKNYAKAIALQEIREKCAERGLDSDSILPKLAEEATVSIRSKLLRAELQWNPAEQQKILAFSLHLS